MGDQHPVDVCNIMLNAHTQLGPLNSLTFYPVGGISAILLGMQAEAQKAGVRCVMVALGGEREARPIANKESICHTE